MSDFNFARPSSVDMNSGGFGIARYGDDANLLIMFYMRSVHNPLKSTQQGMRIHDEVPYVKIQQPGELTQCVDRPVKAEDQVRFRKQWVAFQENREQEQEGVPIDFLFPSHPNIADNLRGLGVHTIDQCANLRAHALDTIGLGGQEYKNRAKQYLDIGAGGAGYHRLKSENADLAAKVATLSRQMDQMRDAYNELYKNVSAPRTLPSNEAMIPARQPMGAPLEMPGIMQQASDLLDPPPPAALDKRHAGPPKKAGRLVNPWEPKPAGDGVGK